MKKHLNKVLLPLLLALGFTSSGCLGPDHLYNSVKNWNADLSEKDWINELVFLGLCIVPIYPLALVGDVLIFNTIDYWTGKSTINDPGAFPGFTSKD